MTFLKYKICLLTTSHLMQSDKINKTQIQVLRINNDQISCVCVVLCYYGNKIQSTDNIVNNIVRIRVSGSSVKSCYKNVVLQNLSSSFYRDIKNLICHSLDLLK